mmetsp:Transcript_48559/g.90110  ORF Transcript_48559/g.90110 Transcript_48559/m.90110 type:complete len:232 (-) Transcript_48559:231-926(-)|eukprot:CAMPEP_0197458880 /NCGR_PEP_ID=MMETSP1175-20131217/49889_1 /TAXON_ID=1003142 /ORGANISM="Triceratium dubium, Strain CCMP147" /LENGTH=231 /DNA_ID=CAMNT_0042993615 /DNA_START=113 /DNA_END=808 /DNA_ORIENTATION=+
MAPLSNLLLVSAVASVSAFSPSTPLTEGTRVSRSRHAQADVKVYENFGFSFAEDQAENTPSVILGEDRYKQWVGEVVDPDNSFLNRQYNVIRRVRELDLIGKTAELGILSKLEKQGLDLETIESLLPQAEKLGLLSLVANNQQLLINLVAPLLVEPAPLLLPAVAGALDVGPAAFYLAAATLAGTEALLVVNNVEVPFVGLSAAAVLGLLLVPLTVVTGGLGVALASAGKK